MSAFVRSAVLNNYVEIARSVHIDPYQQLNAVGISRSVLLNPDIKIPADAVNRLLESSAELAGVIDFGLRMAETRQLSNLGPLALLAREEPTLRQVLESLARHGRLHNETIYQSIEETDGLVIIHENLISGGTGSTRQATELTLGALYRMLRLLVGPAWNPHSVCFSHGAPQILATHLRVFGNRALFGQDFDGFVCVAADLETPNPTYDPEMSRYVRQSLEAKLEDAAASMDDKVRQLVCVLLASGNCSVERVAQHLGKDRRTVYRHLAETNQTFSTIVEEVRIELVTRYVEGKTRPLSEIAGLLGFASLSAFSRWFHTRFGCSATHWRAEVEKH